MGGLAQDWSPAPRKLPGLILWGGPDDLYPENLPLQHFDEASLMLEPAMAPEGHLIVECAHNCGHTLPPFEAPPGGRTLDFLWGFLLDHPYWLPAGASIYQSAPPSSMPSWCAVDAGQATPRPADAACPQ